MTAALLLADVAAQRDLNEVEARTLIDGIRADVSDLDQRIATAYVGRAWIALGYGGWDAMCVAEFDGARLRIPREQRVEQVQSLRAAGLSARAIDAAIGVDESTVRADLRGAGNPAPAAPVVGQDGKHYQPTQPPPPLLRHAHHDREDGRAVRRRPGRRRGAVAGGSGGGGRPIPRAGALRGPAREGLAIASAQQAGISMRDTAALLGITHQRVHQIVSSSR